MHVLRSRSVFAWLAALAAACLLLAMPAGGMAAAAARGRPKLTLTARSSRVTPGVPVRVSLTVRNHSRSAIRGVRLRVAPPRGVRVAWLRARARRNVLTLGTLRARARRTVVARLTPSAGVPASASTTFTLSGRGLRAVTRRVRLDAGRSGPPAPDPAPAPGPTPPAPTPAPAPANPLVGRYFFTYTGLEADGVAFVNDRFAYRGFPSGGFPECAGPTAADDDADGCVPYTFDAATGAIVLGGRPGTWVGDKLTLTTRTDAALSYDELQIPAPGSLVQFQGESLSSIGVCPPSCTYVALGVTLYSDGQFALSTAVSSTTPDGGVTALPPDKRGTYAIEPGARLRLAFADGHVAYRTIAFVPNRDGTTSLFLDGTYYLD